MPCHNNVHNGHHDEMNVWEERKPFPTNQMFIAAQSPCSPCAFPMLFFFPFFFPDPFCLVCVSQSLRPFPLSVCLTCASDEGRNLGDLTGRKEPTNQPTMCGRWSRHPSSHFPIFSPLFHKLTGGGPVRTQGRFDTDIARCDSNTVTTSRSRSLVLS